MISNNNNQSPQDFQEEDYQIPYHHMPKIKDGAWYLGQSWFHGFEYLTLLDYLITKINKLEPNSILDFGCGDGRLITELIKNNSPEKLFGVDISQRALKFANAFNSSDNIFFSSIEDLPVQKFDLIIATEVLEHIEEKNIKKVISDINKIMNDSGTLIITVPSIVRKPIPKKHYRHYDLELLKNHLGESFKIEEISYLNKKTKFSNILRKMIHNRFFTTNLHSYNKFITNLYKKNCYFANQKNGQNIALILNKKS